MKKVTAIILLIVISYLAVFYVSNSAYFDKKKIKLAENGVLTLSDVQLTANESIKLQGEWAFYPNHLLTSTEELPYLIAQRTLVTVPHNLNDILPPIDEEVVAGTYHLTIHVPSDAQYGMYMREIRQANRVFVNNIDVGGYGKTTLYYDDFKAENEDRYTIYAPSHNKKIELLIQVTNLNYMQSGLIHAVDFGLADVIRKEFRVKVLGDVIVSVGYMMFGLIYLIKFLQTRTRKEELYFSIFAIALGLHSATIDQKIFFYIFTDWPILWQLRLQLGLIPIILIGITMFFYYMYPTYLSKKWTFIVVTLLMIVCFMYTVYHPITQNQLLGNTMTLQLKKLLYILFVIPAIIYNSMALCRIVKRKAPGFYQILLVIISIGIYSVFLIINLFTTMPIDGTKAVMFICVLISFASLLNYHANQAYKKIAALSEELLANNKMKDEFLVKTSHELRTPLNGVIHLARALMEGEKGPLKRGQQEQVILIHTVAQRLNYLVEDLLFASHHMAGELRVNKQNTSLAIVNEVINEVKAIQEMNHVPIYCKNDFAETLVYTDAARFKQALYNLLNNALKHTREGAIDVVVERGEQVFWIHVHDTGVGIEHNHLTKIFDSFYQIADHDKKQGLGIGLSIAKNIVEALGGTIKVKSEVGVGSTFSFSIPITKNPIMYEQNTPVIKHMSEQHIVIPYIKVTDDPVLVIVDDNHTNLKVLIDYLQTKPYSIVAFDNGKDAIAYIHGNRVDCMLVDLMLHDMSGHDICTNVRQQYDMLELPIIVLTAIMHHKELVSSLQNGANTYLQKPIDMEELLIRIDSLLAVRQSSMEAIDIEMKYLYSQITPHFIYNTLNTIIGLSYSNMEDTREALYCLATYFRAKLNVHYFGNMVNIHDEIDLVKAYLYIEKLRFGEQLQVQYDIDDTLDFSIPALSLQPLVENAVFHGISKNENGGSVCVTIQQQNKQIILQVKDDGIGMTAEQVDKLLLLEDKGLGFASSIKKFKLLKKTAVQIDSAINEGTIITITMMRE